MKKLIVMSLSFMIMIIFAGCSHSVRYNQYEKSYTSDLSQGEMFGNSVFLLNRDYTQMRMFQRYLIDREKWVVLYVSMADKPDKYYADKESGRVIFDARFRTVVRDGYHELDITFDVRFIIKCRDKHLQIRTLPILLHDDGLLSFPKIEIKFNEDVNKMIDEMAKEIMKKDLW